MKKKQYQRRLVNDLERNECRKDRYNFISYNSEDNREEQKEDKSPGSYFRPIAIVVLFVLIAITDFQNWNPVKWGQNSIKFVQNLIVSQKPPVQKETKSIVIVKPNISGIPEITLTKQSDNTEYSNYFRSLSKAGYAQYFKKYEIQVLYLAKVPLSYLDNMKEAGYLNHYPVQELIAFYKSGIDAGYLNTLKKSGLLNKMSFIDIIKMRNDLSQKG